MRIGLGAGSNSPYALSSNSERTVNLFPEIVESQRGKAKVILYGRPGLSLKVALSGGTGIKGLFYDTATGRTFAVKLMTGGEVRLSELTSSWTTEVDRGQLAASGGTMVPVSIASNGLELLIVNPESTEKAFTLNLASNTLTDRTASVAGTHPRACTFLDGYFCVLGLDGWVYLSALYDGSTWNAAEKQQPSQSPDTAKAIIADHRELWIFGDESIEVWFNNANIDFPFEPLGGTTIQQGILFPYTLSAIDNSLIWVGRGRDGRAVVFRTDGYQVRKISSHAVDAALQGITVTGTKPVSWVYQIHGHPFYVLTFPANNATWVYDPTTEMWHEQPYLNGSTEEAHRGYCAVFVGGEHGAASAYLVGDRANGNIYEQSMAVYQDNGSAIRRERRVQHLSEELKRVFISRVALEIEPVAGDFTLEMSKDGGATYGAAATGRVQFDNAGRVWEALGSSRDAVLRFRSTANVKHAWIDSYMEVQVGAH